MSYLKPCPSCGGPIYSEIVEELARLRDALSAKDREIAELRADCVRKDDHLLAAVQDYNDVRQRTIEECIEAIYAFIERDKDAQVIPYIATAIRSLGKEGSGEQ